MNSKGKVSLAAVLFLIAGLVLAVMSQEAISQPLSYHCFDDVRSFFGVPNFWNVVSNLPFLLVGIAGLRWLRTAPTASYLYELKWHYVSLFAGVALLSVGSAYYHLWPSNETLLWDRLPITIAFMALFAIVLGEFVDLRLGKVMLLPLALYGIFSLAYWYWSELQGMGDLRFYILVQLVPIVTMPLILLFCKAPFTSVAGYWYLLAGYLLAKFFENFDGEVFELIPLLSGHTLKHLLAALGVYCLLQTYRRRSVIAQGRGDC